MKKAGEKLAVLTAYDVLFARILEQAGVDIILVGDSLAQVVLGYDSTLPVTLDEMIHHAAAVRRGAPESFLVVDMPFLSYQISPEEALRNAGRVLKETGAQAVKIEGGDERTCCVVDVLVTAGIPVMGHLGLTPQSVSALGGFRVQGKGAAQARKIVDDARALEDAGAFAVLLEMVPDRVCELITGRARTSFVISLGSGPAAHGQLLIYHDMFGLYPRFKPRMAKLYADAGRVICDGLGAYVQEVRDGSFPQPENYFGMADDAYEELRRAIATDA
jgi:3-methyl-2-oxobutanoate hydroxymethyltransferase